MRVYQCRTGRVRLRVAYYIPLRACTQIQQPPDRGRRSHSEDFPLVYHRLALFCCLLISSILPCTSSNISSMYSIR